MVNIIKEAVVSMEFDTELVVKFPLTENTLFPSCFRRDWIQSWSLMLKYMAVRFIANLCTARVFIGIIYATAIFHNSIKLSTLRQF